VVAMDISLHAVLLVILEHKSVCMGVRELVPQMTIMGQSNVPILRIPLSATFEHPLKLYIHETSPQLFRGKFFK